MYDFHDSTDDDTLKFWTEKWVDVFGEKKKTFLYFFCEIAPHGAARWNCSREFLFKKQRFTFVVAIGRTKALIWKTAALFQCNLMNDDGTK